MILKAKHNFILYPFFKWYAGFIIKRHFGTVRIIGDLHKTDLPVLIIVNHISWWDGFWIGYLNQKVLHRKVHFMMLEEQLRKYWFFNYIGGFSVNKQSKSVIESLQYASELLSDSKNMVFVFPQGEIQSLHQQNIQFDKGLERILKHKENTVQIMFVANLVDYFSDRKPGIYMHVQEYTDPAFDLESIRESYNRFYIQAIEKQKNFNK
jgi:1-acyl-sn-glycerol-3-phosphate acyltransferase